MSPSRRQLSTLLGDRLLSFGATPLAWAQKAATQAPIKLIVPFTPGTDSDLIARTLVPQIFAAPGWWRGALAVTSVTPCCPICPPWPKPKRAM
jgi:hypothetical protein